MGVTFVMLIVVVLPTIAFDHFFGASFLEKFMEERSLLLMGTMLAIYIATASSFLAILLNYEKEKEKVLFINTALEVKRNITLIIVIFVIHFFLLSATPPSTSNSAILISLMVFKVLSFSLYIYALYELSMVFFGIRDKLNSAGEQK